MSKGNDLICLLVRRIVIKECVSTGDDKEVNSACSKKIWFIGNMIAYFTSPTILSAVCTYRQSLNVVYFK